MRVLPKNLSIDSLEHLLFSYYSEEVNISSLIRDINESSIGFHILVYIFSLIDYLLMSLNTGSCKTIIIQNLSSLFSSENDLTIITPKVQSNMLQKYESIFANIIKQCSDFFLFCKPNDENLHTFLSIFAYYLSFNSMYDKGFLNSLLSISDVFINYFESNFNQMFQVTSLIISNENSLIKNNLFLLLNLIFNYYFFIITHSNEYNIEINASKFIVFLYNELILRFKKGSEFQNLFIDINRFLQSSSTEYLYIDSKRFDTGIPCFTLSTPNSSNSFSISFFLYSEFVSAQSFSDIERLDENGDIPWSEWRSICYTGFPTLNSNMQINGLFPGIFIKYYLKDIIIIALYSLNNEYIILESKPLHSQEWYHIIFACNEDNIYLHINAELEASAELRVPNADHVNFVKFGPISDPYISESLLKPNLCQISFITFHTKPLDQTDIKKFNEVSQIRSDIINMTYIQNLELNILNFCIFLLTIPKYKLVCSTNEWLELFCDLFLSSSNDSRLSILYLFQLLLTDELLQKIKQILIDRGKTLLTESDVILEIISTSLIQPMKNLIEFSTLMVNPIHQDVKQCSKRNAITKEISNFILHIYSKYSKDIIVIITHQLFQKLKDFFNKSTDNQEQLLFYFNSLEILYTRNPNQELVQKKIFKNINISEIILEDSVFIEVLYFISTFDVEKLLFDNPHNISISLQFLKIVIKYKSILSNLLYNENFFINFSNLELSYKYLSSLYKQNESPVYHSIWLFLIKNLHKYTHSQLNRFTELLYDSCIYSKISPNPPIYIIKNENLFLINAKYLEAKEECLNMFISTFSLQPMSGLWYYEVTIMTSGSIRLGWISLSSLNEQTPKIGSHLYSWSYDGSKAEIYTGNRTQVLGKQWKIGDKIGCLIDLTSLKMSYSINGELLGDAFSNFRFNQSMYPAISLAADQRCYINIGLEQFSYKPQSYQSLIDYLSINKEFNEESYERMYPETEEGTNSFVFNKTFSSIIEKLNSDYNWIIFREYLYLLLEDIHRETIIEFYLVLSKNEKLQLRKELFSKCFMKDHKDFFNFLFNIFMKPFNFHNVLLVTDIGLSMESFVLSYIDSDSFQIDEIVSIYRELSILEISPDLPFKQSLIFKDGVVLFHFFISLYNVIINHKKANKKMGEKLMILSNYLIDSKLLFIYVDNCVDIYKRSAWCFYTLCNLHIQLLYYFNKTKLPDFFLERIPLIKRYFSQLKHKEEINIAISKLFFVFLYDINIGSNNASCYLLFFIPRESVFTINKRF